MNKCIFIGNLTRDPESGSTNSGISYCRFSIAVNRTYSNANGEREADFINIVTWRGLADTVGRYARKGNKVAVSGSIQMRTYEDNQGIKRTAVDVIAQDVEFLTPRSSSNQGDDFYDSPAPAQNSAPARKKPTLQSFDDDGDIPF